jgi:DNA-binding HxlR family transcriptional regulator
MGDFRAPGDVFLADCPRPALRRLQRHGIVTRSAYPEVPPGVEYDLTDLGRTLIEPIAALTRWAEANGVALLEAVEEPAAQGAG